MKCTIELNWKGVDERMTLARDKKPDEVWTAPGGDARAVLQMIEVLDQTFGDIRAALIALLPPGQASAVKAVLMLDAAQEKEFSAWWDNK